MALQLPKNTPLNLSIENVIEMIKLNNIQNI